MKISFDWEIVDISLLNALEHGHEINEQLIGEQLERMENGKTNNSNIK